MYKEVSVSGWGRVRRGAAAAARPERVADVARLFANSQGRTICGRGAGRSYGDCALNSGGVLVLTERLNRILSFDETTGEISAEPGVTFRQLLRHFLPRGWLAPVSPGTGFVTIGGAVANDVHGKNHEHAGSFGQHVVELDIMTPDGVLHTISPTKRPEWFRATVGGLGLTGVLTRIVFRLIRVPGPCVTVHERRIADLDGFFAAFDDAKGASYSVGWIDALSRGRSMGRGVLEIAEPDGQAACAPRHAGPRVVADFPNFALNSVTVAAFNAAIFARAPARGRVRARHYSDFLYPLDAVQDWNRIYGKRGFHQLQCVVPKSTGLKAVSALLNEIVQAGSASMLAVLKRLGAGRAGYLSFPMEGYTLAVDFPNSAAIAAAHEKLARIVLDHGGRVYLAKDALLTAAEAAKMYPELPEFRTAAAEMDPTTRMASDLSRRLHLRSTS
jgi:decaprenylphospho-beta-D-ribofuranose 2-oxidase